MHFDQNIILIVAAAIYGISRLISRIAESSREQSQRRNRKGQSAPATQTQAPPPNPQLFTRPKTDEERVREFLEALGQPAGTTPPPKIQPRTDIPARPVAPISPPPLARPFSPVLLRPMVEKARKVFTPPSSAPPPETAEPDAWLREEERIGTAAAKFEAATGAATDDLTSSREGAGMSWKNALRSRESIRAALVLREILGPPRALREL